MIEREEAEPEPQRRTRRKPRLARQKLPKGPLEVRLTLRIKFGDEPEEVVTMMEDRRVPMVDSVFRSRDVILNSFVKILLKAGMAQPRVARELMPLFKLLRRR